MSVLNKKPYINKVLESLSDAELSTLSVLMNGGGDQTELLRIWGFPSGLRTPITNADKGVHLCSLQVGPTLYHGYLLFTNSFCTLVHFTDFQTLSMFDIDLANNFFNTVTEYLDINELRTEVFKLSFSDGGGAGDSDDLFKVIQGSLTSVSIDKTLATVRPYVFANMDTLLTVELANVTADIGEKAFYNCENISSLKLGVIDGEIKAGAFYGLINVEEFELDPASVITNLGANCFSGIGMERVGDQRFYFDFRNSTFTSFCGFGTAGEPASFDSGTGETIGGTPGIGIVNAEIRLPSTVTALGANSSDGMSSGSGSGAILESSENIDLYFTGTAIVPLTSMNLLPTDAASHIYVPYSVFGDYKVATNWTALSNLFGYADDITAGQTLPTYDSEGYELEWYADKAMTEVITNSNGHEMYCAQTETRLFSKVLLSGSYDGTIEIVDSQNNVINVGDLIPIGTEITITAVPNNVGDELIYFDVNGSDYTSAGTATLTVGQSNIAVEVYYNAVPLPEYLECFYFNEEGYGVRQLLDLPSNLIIRSKYVLSDDRIVDIILIGDYGFRSQQLVTVTTENGIKYIQEYVFENCNNLTHVYLPNSIVEIDRCAFEDCTSLVDITFPNSISQALGYGLLRGCSSLESVTCPTTTNIASTPYPLHQSGFQALFADEYNVVIPSTLTTVILTSPCDSIGSYCFQGMNFLTSVTVPTTVTSIGVDAFHSCSSLTTLTYQGTMSQWNSINKDTDWKRNSSLTTIHCTDGDITL